MSEVRKYKALGDMTPRSRIGGGEWVRLEDYDAAQVELAALRLQCGGMQMSLDEAAEREDALREELSSNEMIIQELAGANDEQQQRLTAAEQRNAELVELLRDVVELPGARSIRPRTLWAKVDAALKPTESGASE